MEAARAARRAAPRRRAPVGQRAAVDAASDAELVARCRAGDQAAWDALVERYARYVHAIVARVYRLELHDAEDVFQDVFTRVFERLDTLRDGDALRPWIAQTTRNCCRRRAAPGRARDAWSTRCRTGADDGLAQLDEAMTVHAALDRLSPRVPRDPRPLLLPRRELPHDRRRSSSCPRERSRAGSPAASRASATCSSRGRKPPVHRVG